MDFNTRKDTSQIKVIYEDNHLLILSKPSGLLSVPDATGDFSLLDWGKEYLKKTRGKPGNVFLGVVHRLDRPVSGLICFAVTSKAASRLSQQIREHQFNKTYLALVSGFPIGKEGCMEHLLLKDERKNMAVIYPLDKKIKGAKYAKTCWRLLKRFNSVCLLELNPVTGRSHQLRAQLAAHHFPILGDLKYGAPSPLPDKSIALHAFRIEFFHPTRKEKLAFEDLPPDRVPWKEITI